MFHCALMQSPRVGKIFFESCHVSFSFSAACTTASLALVKKCLNGIEVDDKCLHEEYENLSEAEDKACFCGGLVKISEMLTSVEALLCHRNQGRVARLFFPGGGIFPNWFATTQATTTGTTTGTAVTTTAPIAAPTTAYTAVTTTAPDTTQTPQQIPATCPVQRPDFQVIVAVLD